MAGRGAEGVEWLDCGNGGKVKCVEQQKVRRCGKCERQGVGISGQLEGVRWPVEPVWPGWTLARLTYGHAGNGWKVDKLAPGMPVGMSEWLAPVGTGNVWKGWIVGRFGQSEVGHSEL